MRVGERAEPVRRNEPATRPSPVGPLFTIPGSDPTDPRECIPEDRVDFEPNRSVKPADRKPVRANAIDEGARQRALTAVLHNPARSEPPARGEMAGGSRRSQRNSSPSRVRLSRGRPSVRKTEPIPISGPNSALRWGSPGAGWRPVRRSLSGGAPGFHPVAASPIPCSR
jgi:hypothetical protein